MLRPNTVAMTALIGLLAAIGPLTVDLYLPSLPEIGRELTAPTAQVQLTISCYLVGFAVGQFGYGPVSDVYGRRPVLLVALAVFCLATLLCVFAPDIGWLILARTVQAIGSSGSVVLARAMVRDLYSGARAGREMAIISMIMGIAPVAAPTAGGLLQAAFGWRACFVFVLMVGASAAVLVWRLLPETRPPQPGRRFEAGVLLEGCVEVIRNPGFRAHLALMSLSFAGLFAFISGSPFVLQDVFGLSPLAFALAFAVVALGFIAGTTIAMKIVMRVGLNRTIGFGAGMLAFASIALVTATMVLPDSAVALILPMALYMAGIGLAMPQATAAALLPFPSRAGTASSLAGVVQQGAAAISGALVGHLLSTTAWPLVAVVACMGVLTFGVWAATVTVRVPTAP